MTDKTITVTTERSRKQPQPRFDCPACKHKQSHVTDSRVAVNARIRKLGVSIRRRHECDLCKTRFTTYEIPGDVYDMLVAREEIASAIENAASSLTQALTKASSSVTNAL